MIKEDGKFQERQSILASWRLRRPKSMNPVQWPMSQGEGKADVPVQRPLGRDNSLSRGR